MVGNSVFDAAYSAAHDYPGGIAAIVARINAGAERKASASVLAHQLNPNDMSNPLTVANLNRVITLTGNHNPVHAFCMDHGYMALPLPDQTSDDMTAEALTDTCKEFADYLQSVTAALSDHKVTANELKRVRKELGELVASAGHLEAILAKMESKRGR